jgi:mannose-6-phosphate isomerase-like protein (cupin superfamily)
MSALLRAVRQQRGKSYLSKIERQRSTPSIAVAMRLARALDVDVAQLFAEDQSATTSSVDRAEERDPSRYHAVAASMLGKAMSPFVVRPTLKFSEHPHPAHAGQELVFVHAGAVELRLGDDSVALEAGDCVYFDSSIPHQLRQRGSTRSEVLVVIHTEYTRNR